MKNLRSFLAVILVSGTALLIAANLSSCTKSNTKTVTDYDTVTIKDTVNDTVKVATAPSILSMLTGKQWEFDSVYDNYTGPGTGTVVYARGGASNAVNLDNYFGTFTIEGQYWQVANTTTYAISTWNFTSSDSNLLKIVSTTYGTDYFRIISLSANRFAVYDSVANALDIEIPAP